MSYEIKYNPVFLEGKEIPKYNIYYIGGDCDGLIEFHSIDGINGSIREEYRLILLTDEQLIAAFNRLKELGVI